jgi:hypothetical protein
VRQPRTAGYAGAGLLVLAFTAVAVAALLGPSATEAPLGRHDDPATPPWHVLASPPPWLVTALLAVAVLAGAGAVALGLTGRWRPPARRLLAAGVLAAATLSLLPPVGSADPLSYAAYGRAVTTGHDPYTTEPAQLAARGDPVGQAVEVPWQRTPSVYGPLASAEQAAASAVAGTDVAVTVLLLDLVGAAVFVGSGLLLYRLAHDDVGRRRAVLLWTANPLLWLQLVAGAHLDVLAAGGVLTAVAVAGRSRVAAGALAGAAAAVKAPAGLVWLALAWSVRRSVRSVLALAVGAVLVAGTGYAVAGIAAYRQLSRASTLVSFGTPWRLVSDLTDPGLGHGASRRLIGLLSLGLFALLVVALSRLSPAGPPATGTSGPRVPAAAVVALVLALGYVLAAAYALPWYDAVPWALLPLVARSRLDVILLVHTTVLSLAYIPGRAAVPLHGALHALTSGMRSGASPTLLVGLLVVVIVTAVWDSSRGGAVAADSSLR